MISRSMQITIALLVAAILGMSFYALKLKQKVETLHATSDNRPAAPPVTGALQTVTLWVAHDDGTLHQQQMQLAMPNEPAARAMRVLQALVQIYTGKDSPHPLGAGADIEDVYLVNGTTAVVDLNQTFADTHPSGIMVEQLTIISMIQTLAANVPNVTRVKFLVGGKERDTLAGHEDLKMTYDVSTVSQVAQELQ